MFGDIQCNLNRFAQGRSWGGGGGGVAGGSVGGAPGEGQAGG